MGKSIMYVGLDQHKESIEIATADEGRDGRYRFVWLRINTSRHHLSPIFQSLVECCEPWPSDSISSTHSSACCLEPGQS